MAHQHYKDYSFTWRWIGPEIITVAVEVLKVVGEQLDLGFTSQP